MSTGDKLCLTIGPLIGFIVGILALNIDMTALAQTHWSTLSVLLFMTLAGPNAVGIKHIMRATRT